MQTSGSHVWQLQNAAICRRGKGGKVSEAGTDEKDLFATQNFPQ